MVVGGEGVGSVFSVCAAERTSAAGLLWVSQSGAYLRKTGVGGARRVALGPMPYGDLDYPPLHPHRPGWGAGRERPT